MTAHDAKVPQPDGSRKGAVRAAGAGSAWDAPMALLLIAYCSVWLTHLSSTSLSPPTDNIEQLNWVHSLEWGYYKHPPFPTWLFWPLVRLFGANAWTSYAAAAITNLASMAILWTLLYRLRGQAFARLALLSTLCITYYSLRFHAYNHNTVLMLISTGCAALCWQAHVTGQLRWWIALGVLLGLGALTKYQIAVTVTCVVAFWLTQRGWRDPQMRRGLLLSALTALVVFAPHLHWMRNHDFGPIGYAVDSALGARVSPLDRISDVLKWLLDQLLNRALPAWLMLALALLLGRRAPPAGALAANQTAARGASCGNPGRSLLYCWGLLPLAFMSLTELGAGSRLNLRWGSPFLLFVVPAAMELLGRRIAWEGLSARTALKAFLVVQFALLVLNHLTSPFGPPAMRERHWRAFDSGLLARKIEPHMRNALAGTPVCIISGPTYIAGALSLEFAERPLVLIDGRLDHSPWVQRAMTQTCPMLVLRQGEPPKDAQALGPEFPNLWWQVVLPR